MKKVLSFYISLLFLLSTASSSYAASLVTIKGNGEMSINVLSAETGGEIDIQKPSSLSVNKVAKSDTYDDATISLSKDSDKVSLHISSESGNKSLDISNWTEDIVEIEEQPEVQKLKVILENGKFSLKQKGVSATTDKPILIDSKLKELSVKTDSGNKFLAILPYEAVQTLLKTKVVNEVSQNNLEITEDGENLAYKIEGNKVINFFNVYSYKIPVSSYVSASSGEILRVDSPTIYKYVTFLFV